MRALSTARVVLGGGLRKTSVFFSLSLSLLNAAKVCARVCVCWFERVRSAGVSETIDCSCGEAALISRQMIRFYLLQLEASYTLFGLGIVNYKTNAFLVGFSLV